MSNRQIPDSVAKLTEEFVKEIRGLYQDRLDKVILFGSYARGEQTEDSDIDYLVVLNDKEIRSLSEISFISPVTNSLGLKHGVWISAIPVTAEKWNIAKSGLIENAKEEGIIL